MADFRQIFDTQLRFSVLGEGALDRFAKKFDAESARIEARAKRTAQNISRNLSSINREVTRTDKPSAELSKASKDLDKVLRQRELLFTQAKKLSTQFDTLSKAKGLDPIIAKSARNVADEFERAAKVTERSYNKIRAALSTGVGSGSDSTKGRFDGISTSLPAITHKGIQLAPPTTFLNTGKSTVKIPATDDIGKKIFSSSENIKAGLASIGKNKNITQPAIESLKGQIKAFEELLEGSGIKGTKAASKLLSPLIKELDTVKVKLHEASLVGDNFRNSIQKDSNILKDLTGSLSLPGPKITELTKNLRQLALSGASLSSLFGPLNQVVSTLKNAGPAYAGTARDAEKLLSVVISGTTALDRQQGELRENAKVSLNNSETKARQTQAESALVAVLKRQAASLREVSRASREITQTMVSESQKRAAAISKEQAKIASLAGTRLDPKNIGFPNITGGTSGTRLLSTADQLSKERLAATPVPPKVASPGGSGGGGKKPPTRTGGVFGKGSPAPEGKPGGVLGFLGVGGSPMLPDRGGKASFALNQLSGAAAGLLLATSALDRNITGLAFSLIFLKFNIVGTALVFASLTIAVGTFIKTIQSAASAFAALEPSLEKLRGLTGSVQEAGAQFKFANAEARKFGFDPSDAIAGLTTLNKNFLASKDTFRAVEELAAGTGITVEAASQQFSQAIGLQTGSLETLREAGIKVTKQQAEQFNQLDRGARLAEVSRLINEKFAGSAERHAKTLGGAVNRLQGAMQYLFFTLGGPIAKLILIPFINALANLFNKMASVAEAFFQSAGGLKLLGEISSVVQDILEELGLSGEKAGEKFKNRFAAALFFFFTVLKLVLQAILLFIRLIKGAVNALIDFIRTIKPVIQLLGFLAQKLKNLNFGSILNTFKKFAFDLPSVSRAIARGLISAIPEALFRRGVIALAKLIGEDIPRILKGLPKTLDDIFTKINNFNIDDLVTGLKRIPARIVQALKGLRQKINLGDILEFVFKPRGELAFLETFRIIRDLPDTIQTLLKDLKPKDALKIKNLIKDLPEKEAIEFIKQNLDDLTKAASKINPGSVFRGLAKALVGAGVFIIADVLGHALIDALPVNDVVKSWMHDLFEGGLWGALILNPVSIVAGIIGAALERALKDKIPFSLEKGITGAFVGGAIGGVLGSVGGPIGIAIGIAVGAAIGGAIDYAASQIDWGKLFDGIKNLRLPDITKPFEGAFDGIAEILNRFDFSGVFDALKRSVSEAIPIVSAISAPFEEAGKTLAFWIEKIDAAIQRIGYLNAALILLKGFLGPIIPVLVLLKKAWEENFLGIQQITTFALQFILDTIALTLNLIVGVAQIFAGTFQMVFGTLFALLRGDWEAAWTNIKEGFMLQVEGIKLILTSFVLFFIDSFNNIRNNIVPAIETAVLQVYGALLRLRDGAVQLVTDMTTNIVNKIAELPGLIASQFLALAGAGAGIGNAIIGGIKSAFGAIGGFAVDIGKQVASAIIRLVNTNVIDRLNSALKFDFKVKGVGITVDAPDIPHLSVKLAKGGIVTRATNAIIGEAGAEAVIPLKNSDFAKSIASAVTTSVSSVVEEVKLIVDEVSGIISAVEEVVKETEEGIKEAGVVAGQTIAQEVKETVSNVGRALSEFITTTDKGTKVDLVGAIQSSGFDTSGVKKTFFKGGSETLAFLDSLGIKIDSGTDAFFGALKDVSDVMRTLTSDFGFKVDETGLDFEEMRKVAQKFGDDLVLAGQNAVSLSNVMEKFTPIQKTLHDAMLQLGDSVQQAAQNVLNAGHNRARLVGDQAATDEFIKDFQTGKSKRSDNEFFFSLPDKERNALATLLVELDKRGKLPKKKNNPLGFATGGTILTKRALGFVDLATGNMLGVAGEKTREMISISPISNNLTPRSSGGSGGMTQINITISDSVIGDDRSKKLLAELVGDQISDRLKRTTSVFYR